MGWFSKSTDGFFLSTTTPPDIARSQYLGIVNGETVIGATDRNLGTPVVHPLTFAEPTERTFPLCRLAINAKGP
jgi:hypothetical protein